MTYPWFLEGDGSKALVKRISEDEGLEDLFCFEVLLATCTLCRGFSLLGVSAHVFGVLVGLLWCCVLHAQTTTQGTTKINSRSKCSSRTLAFFLLIFFN